MKKNKITSLVLALFVLLISGCSKGIITPLPPLEEISPESTPLPLPTPTPVPTPTIDTIAPVIVLSANSESIALNSVFTHPSYTITDDTDAGLSIVLPTVDTSVAGVVLLTYTSTDLSGNEGSAVFSLTILPDTTSLFIHRYLIGTLSTRYQEITYSGGIATSCTVTPISNVTADTCACNAGSCTIAYLLTGSSTDDNAEMSFTVTIDGATSLPNTLNIDAHELDFVYNSANLKRLKNIGDDLYVQTTANELIKVNKTTYATTTIHADILDFDVNLDTLYFVRWDGVNDTTMSSYDGTNIAVMNSEGYTGHSYVNVEATTNKVYTNMDSNVSNNYLQQWKVGEFSGWVFNDASYSYSNQSVALGTSIISDIDTGGNIQIYDESGAFYSTAVTGVNGKVYGELFESLGTDKFSTDFAFFRDGTDIYAYEKAPLASVYNVFTDGAINDTYPAHYAYINWFKRLCFNIDTGSPVLHCFDEDAHELVQADTYAAVINECAEITTGVNMCNIQDGESDNRLSVWVGNEEPYVFGSLNAGNSSNPTMFIPVGNHDMCFYAEGSAGNGIYCTK